MAFFIIGKAASQGSGIWPVFSVILGIGVIIFIIMVLVRQEMFFGQRIAEISEKEEEEEEKEESRFLVLLNANLRGRGIEPEVQINPQKTIGNIRKKLVSYGEHALFDTIKIKVDYLLKKHEKNEDIEKDVKDLCKELEKEEEAYRDLLRKQKEKFKEEATSSPALVDAYYKETTELLQKTLGVEGFPDEDVLIKLFIETFKYEGRLKIIKRLKKYLKEHDFKKLKMLVEKHEKTKAQKA